MEVGGDGAVAVAVIVADVAVTVAAAESIVLYCLYCLCGFEPCYHCELATVAPPTA